MAKRKRLSLKSSGVQEEVKGKSGDTRLNTRQERRARSFNVNGKEAVGKKMKKHDGITKENRIWFVTCENKQGVMDIEKLKRGEDCIESEGLWFTPSAFEEFAGRGYCKKWKSSISHEGRPLIHWFGKGILSTSGYLRRGTESIRKIESSTKKESKTTKSLRKGIRATKRPSNSVTQINIPLEGCIPTEGAELQPIDGAEGRGVEDDNKNPHTRTQFLKSGQESKDGSDGKSHGCSGDAKDPNQSKTGDGAVGAGDYPKDHRATKESCRDRRIGKAQTQELKTRSKVITRRLSVTRRTRSTREHPNEDSWCEPCRDRSKETEENTVVSKAHMEESETEVNNNNENVDSSLTQLVTCDNKDKTGENKDIRLERVYSLFPEVSPQVHSGELCAIENEEVTSRSLLKEETTDSIRLPAAHLNLLLQHVCKNDTKKRKPKHDGPELETPGAQVSVCSQASEILENRTSGVSDVDLDAMDLDQMKREKIKMQLKVLKLQEKYYTFLINDMEKSF